MKLLRAKVERLRSELEAKCVELQIIGGAEDLDNRGELGLSSYELNRQRNNRINECNCRGIAVMCVQCTMRTDDAVK